MNSLTINIRSPKPSINWSHLPEKIRTLFKQDDIANLLKELKKIRTTLENYKPIYSHKLNFKYYPSLVITEKGYISIEQNLVLDFIFKYLITYPEIKSEKILNYAINNYQLCYFNIYYSYFTFYLNYFLNKKDKAETLKKIYLNQSLWEDLMKQHLFYTAVVNEYPINSKTYIPEYIFDVTSFPIRINSSHKQFKNILKNKIPSLFFILKEDNLKLKMWKKVKTNKRYSFLKSELINSFNKNPKMAIYNLKIKALTILAQDIPEIYSMPSQSNKKNQTLFLAIIENHFISMDLSEKELKSKFKWLFSLFKTRYIKQLFYQEEKVLNSLFQKNGLYSYWEILLSQIELEKLKNDFNNENLHQIKSL